MQIYLFFSAKTNFAKLIYVIITIDKSDTLHRIRFNRFNLRLLRLFFVKNRKTYTMLHE